MAAGLAATLFIISGCSQSMVISRVNYSQPIESVLTPDEDGVVRDGRNGIAFNMLPLQYEETQDTSSVTTSELRYIRGKKGFFYITAPAYRHEYLMAPEEGALELREKFLIGETGIEQPAFNQRDTFIQLVDRATGDSYRLTPEGLEREGAADNEAATTTDEPTIPEEATPDDEVTPEETAPDETTPPDGTTVNKEEVTSDKEDQKL